MTTKDPSKLEQLLGYEFSDKRLLREALTHRSFAYEHIDEPDVSDNERLEFLGDAVLGLAMSHFLWHRFPDYSEGELSRLRSALVNEKMLSHIADRWNLSAYLFLGKGEEQTGGRRKPSILADAVEAILGALYIDGGWQRVLDVVERQIIPVFDVFQSEDPLKNLHWDYKTRLQEWLQAQYKKTPVYRLDREEGPEHDKVFYVSVMMDDMVLARGRGKTKKEAQQNAAQAAYQKLAKKK